MPILYDTVKIRRSLTRHTCSCGHEFYVRASYYNCPKCGKECFKEINLDLCNSLLQAVCREFSKYIYLSWKEDIINKIMLSFPGYNFDQIKLVYEEFCNQ